METLGKSINLFLIDGSASRRWQAKLDNWNSIAYKIPRDDLKNCDDLPELSSPGVYFLFGKDDESGKQFIYIGESDNARKRILQRHFFERDGSYWTEAVIFITPDGTLEKGRIRYLENRFYTIACNAKRYIVKNANMPAQSPMQRQIQDWSEAFIKNAKLVLQTLGHNSFVPLPSSEVGNQKTNDELLHFVRNRGKGGDAMGRVTADGFWVLKGSYIFPDVAEYTSAGIKEARRKYANIIGTDNKLKEDICFGSPSYASTFVCGKTSNGLAEWKNKSGVSLKELDFGEKTSVENIEKTHGISTTTVDSNEKSEMLHLAGKKVSAFGKLDDNGFIVLKGSGFSATETKACQAWIKNLRAKLLLDGKVENNIFTEDVCFNSASAAAACISGHSVNGRIAWLYSNGESIKDRSTNGN